MFSTCFGIVTRIISNSTLNVFQKILTSSGQRPSAVNFFTYLGLTLLGILLFPCLELNTGLIKDAAVMGILGALGNYFIIKALSIGELSTIAPINSYKPIVAMLAGIIFLKEFPDIYSILGLVLIIAGTFFVINPKIKANKKAVLYRILALVFSATEAVFIKRVILGSNITTAFFLWAAAGLLFAILFVIVGRHRLRIASYKYQILLILTVGIMQYSTNFVFARMEVAPALALFQLSTLLSVFLGANLFHEQGLKQKLIGSIIMILGAVIIILN